MDGDNLIISFMICLLCCFTPSSLVYSAVTVDQLRIDNTTTYTLIHGGDDTRLNHSDAEIYCQNLGKLELNPNIHGHLASLHDKNTSRHIMKWLLQRENHYIYIGGIVRKMDNEGSESFNVFWSDSSPDNYRNLYLRSSKLRRMRPYERRCLAIDYINGQWDVHHCNEKLAFLCEIRYSNETVNHKDNSLLAKEEFHNKNVKGGSQPKHFRAHEEVSNHFQRDLMPFQQRWHHHHPNHHRHHPFHGHWWHGHRHGWHHPHPHHHHWGWNHGFHHHKGHHHHWGWNHGFHHHKGPRHHWGWKGGFHHGHPHPPHHHWNWHHHHHHHRRNWDHHHHHHYHHHRHDGHHGHHPFFQHGHRQ
jgi:hypothetical protein